MHRRRRNAAAQNRSRSDRRVCVCVTAGAKTAPLLSATDTSRPAFLHLNFRVLVFKLPLPPPCEFSKAGWKCSGVLREGAVRDVERKKIIMAKRKWWPSTWWSGDVTREERTAKRETQHVAVLCYGGSCKVAC